MNRTLAALLLAALALPASARLGKEKDGSSEPCKADVEKFCKDVSPGGGRIMKCMKEHKDELSEECKKRGKAMKGELDAKRAEAEGACKDDKEKFCKDIEPGGGRIIKCMKEHEKDLSEKCGAFMASKEKEMKGKHEEAEEACRADQEKLCKDVEPGEGRIMKCMHEHQGELSEKCRAFADKKKGEWNERMEKRERQDDEKDEKGGKDEKEGD